MATLSTAGRSAAAVAILALIDAGSAANILITTSAPADLVEITLNDPSFTESGGVLTLDVTPAVEAVATGAGEAALFSIRSSADTVVINGTISDTGSPDIDIDDATIGIGDTVGFSSLTVTVPAS